MVSEGAAFVVAAQGGTCLLAVGTFLEGKKCTTSAFQSHPLLQAFPKPHLSSLSTSLWLQVCGGGGVGWSIANLPPTDHTVERIQQECFRPGLTNVHKQIKQNTAVGQGPQTRLWCSSCPPTRTHACPSFPRSCRILKCQLLPVYFCCESLG